MLKYELTKKHAGIVLWGDPWTLMELREFVRRVNDESVLIANKEGSFLGLAYDLRKAYEGQRSKGSVCEGTPLDDVCPLYGVETLWPVIISQVGMLRAAMGFVPTSRHDQALVFALEALVESALQEALPHQAEQCLDLMARIGVDAEHADRRLNSRGRYFIETAPRDRLRALPMLLESMLPMYDILAPVWERSGVPGVIPLAVLDACDRKEDWPQFEW